MTLRLLLIVVAVLVSTPGFAWEFIVGGGMTQPRFTTDFKNDVTQIEDYELKLDNGFKAYARFNFTPYFGIQAESANYGDIISDETLSETNENVITTADIHVESEIKSVNYSLFIGSNRDDFFAMFGKFGYSSFSNQLLATVTSTTNPPGPPGTLVYTRDELIEDNAPLLGFGVSFRLPWDLFILAEYEIINGDDQDIESANALIEYRF